MKLIKLLMTDHDAEGLRLVLEEQEEEGAFGDAFTMHIEDAGADIDLQGHPEVAND